MNKQSEWSHYGVYHPKWMVIVSWIAAFMQLPVIGTAWRVAAINRVPEQEIIIWVSYSIAAAAFIFTTAIKTKSRLLCALGTVVLCSYLLDKIAYMSLYY